MRILTVTAGLKRGGSERAAQNFSTAYRALGHEVAVLVWKEGGARQGRLEAADIPVFDGVERLDSAVEAADAFRPEVIHVHRVGIAQPAETHVLRKLKTGDRRVIETNIFGRADTTDAARLIDVHMHLSAWCLWRWQRWLGDLPDAPVGVVVPNPVDCSAFVRADADRVASLRGVLGIPADAYLCGRVGQPHRANWHPRLFDAFTRVAELDPKAYLLLVGLPAALRPLLQRLPPDAARRVRELGVTDSDAELSTAYSAMDCFLHAASAGESFGYVLTEAMLCGCPVVTASTPHVSNSHIEIVGHLEGGVVAGSISRLPDAAAWLWARPLLRTRIRPGLRLHVESRFDAGRVASLALQVATLALQATDRSALRRSIGEAPQLRSRVTRDDIRRLLAHTLGRARLIELAQMRVRHSPAVQRVIDRRLMLRLARAAVQV